MRWFMSHHLHVLQRRLAQAWRALWASALALLASAALVPIALAAPPKGYPKAYGAIVAAAREEASVVVYSTTDLSTAAALIRDFELLAGVNCLGRLQAGDRPAAC